MALITGGNAAQSLTVLNTTSSAKTPTASNNYHALTGNSISLTAGTWMLFGYALFTNGGVTPTYTDVSAGWYGANGADTLAAPTTILSGVSGLTVVSAYNSGGSGTYLNTASNFAVMALPVPTVIVTLTSTQSIFLVSYATMTTAANARVTVYPSARRLY